MLVDPAHASYVTAVEEVPEHGLPGHNAVRYTLNINAPMQRVMKLCKLPPFSLPPRDDTDLEEICTELLHPHMPQWDSLLDTRASVDRLWEFWTWLAEETGLALSCDGLTTDTAKPIPYAPYAVGRVRGTDDMLMEATLCPTKTTKLGAPRTKLLSKIQSALGSLRPVVRWARSRLGTGRDRRQKALQGPTLLGPMPQQVRYDRDAVCRRMRKIRRPVRNDLSLQEL